MTTVDETTSFLSKETLTTIILELTKKARSLEKEIDELLAKVREQKEEIEGMEEDNEHHLSTIDSLKSEFRAKESKMETKLADLQAKLTAKSNNGSKLGTSNPTTTGLFGSSGLGTYTSSPLLGFK